MATILAAATGNWSNTATWTGGVVPGPGDIAVANTRTITLDVASITVGSIRTTTDGGASAAGGFALGLADTVINGDIIAGGSICLTGLSPGRTLTATNVIGGSGSYCSGINMTGGTLTATSVTGGSNISAFGINMIDGTLTATSVIGGSGSGPAYGINMTGGTLTATSVIGGSGTISYGINITGGTLTATSVTGSSVSTTAYGINVNSASAIAHVTYAEGTGKAPGLYVAAGVATLYEAIGSGYGPSSSGSNIVSAYCTSAGRLGVKKITFGPLGQCPIGGNARLIPDEAIPTPFFIPLDSDYPAAGSGSNPAFTTATTLSQQVAATVGEILRTQP